MAGPVPTYLSTQTAAQTAFTVPFGLLALTNAAIATAVADGQFNVTVDCSLFSADDITQLRVYLDSLGYHVDFAKNTSNKSLNIDWARFLDTAEIIVNQGTSPWIVAGTVTANQGTSPWLIDGTVAATQSGAWTTGRTWALSSGADSVSAVQSGTWTVQQGTPPWSVSQSGAWTVTATQGTSPWVTTSRGSTSAITQVSVTNAVSVTLLAANANRKKAIFTIPVIGTALYIGYTATTNTTTTFTHKVVTNNAQVIEDSYTGVISAISTGVANLVTITEIT